MHGTLARMQQRDQVIVSGLGLTLAISLLLLLLSGSAVLVTAVVGREGSALSWVTGMVGMVLLGVGAWAVGSQSVVKVTPDELRRPLRRPVSRADIVGVYRLNHRHIKVLNHSGKLVGSSQSGHGVGLLPTMTPGSADAKLADLAEALEVPFLEG